MLFNEHAILLRVLTDDENKLNFVLQMQAAYSALHLMFPTGLHNQNQPLYDSAFETTIHTHLSCNLPVSYA